MSDSWTTSEIPDQSGRTALITGANSGIGKQAASALAKAGATVLVGCRDTAKGERAIAEIRGNHKGGELDLVEIDLADLSSVEAAAKAVRQRGDDLDLLICNAGVMATPKRRTADGFELQLGTNHLGHFALTGHLVGKLLEAPAARIVNVSSLAHRQGSMDFGDLNWERDYSRWGAYGRSKLANLMFTFELDRR
ncbi:MAG: oxidoreductase, partial [Solirubrobacterales bacterium]